MKCPRCVQRIHRTAACCPHCGYGIGDADRRFGGTAPGCGPADGWLADHAGLLRRRERVRVRRDLARFRAVFPQLVFAVVTTSAGVATAADLRQFGFWLLNRGAFGASAVVLVIDPNIKAAGIVWGYLLDPYLSEADTFRHLAKAHPYLLGGDYGAAVRTVLRGVMRTLRWRCGRARLWWWLRPRVTGSVLADERRSGGSVAGARADAGLGAGQLRA